MDLHSFLTGSLGGLTAIVASYPFDTIKTRVQNQNSAIFGIQYKGALDCFYKSITKESVWSLYRGMSSPLIGSMFINSVLFGVESNVRKNLDFEKANSSFERYKFYATSGAIGGLVQGILLTPIEVVKLNMQLENSKYRSSFECVKNLIKNKGINSLSRGFLLTIIRETPACSLYFVSFEMILDSFDVIEKKHTLWHLLLAGGTSGCISWLLTYPIDVVKTRFTANTMLKSVKCCILNTYKAEGLIGFWRGLSCALLRAFPNNSVCFATVALLNRAFEN